MSQSLTIHSNSGRLEAVTIGPEHPVFTIAEIGLNHNGDISIAKKLIDSASNAGCSSVKFQNFETDEVYIKGSKAGKYSLLGNEIDIYDLHKQLEIEQEFLSELKDYAEKKGLFFFSAPMGRNSLDCLINLKCDLIKISSYEISNIPWINTVAKTNKPIIMSCGGSTISEVERALAEIYKFHKKVALMHCVIKYPAESSEANLKVMNTLRSAFEIPVGFSNNGFIDKGKIDFQNIPYTASALGMDLYEVHVTLDRSMDGVDQGFSTEPDELKSMIQIINDTRAQFQNFKEFKLNDLYVGSGIKQTLPCEQYVRDFAYKSIFSIKKIKKGEKLDSSNIKCLRSGEHDSGLEPIFFNIINDHFYAKKDIDEFEPINWKVVTT